MKYLYYSLLAGEHLIQRKKWQKSASKGSANIKCLHPNANSAEIGIVEIHHGMYVRKGYKWLLFSKWGGAKNSPCGPDVYSCFYIMNVLAR